MSDWEKRDVWTKRERTFAVEVSHHEAPPLRSGLAMDEGPHRWAVYAYVYPEHPLFKALDANGGIWQAATGHLPLHVGCSLFRTHRREDGAITSYQIGADYHHLYDEFYTHMATREDARLVFLDAEALCEALAASGSAGAADPADTEGKE